MKISPLSQSDRWQSVSDHFRAIRREQHARNQADPAWRRERIRTAARDLLLLQHRCPELFEHVLPIDDEARRTLIEILQADDEEEPDHVR